MKVLVLIGFTSLFLVCTLTNAVLARAVGVWLFEEGKGEVVSDSSRNGNHGEIIGKAKWVDEGKFGRALSLSGVGNYVSIPDSPALSSMKQITVMVWIKPDDSSIANGACLLCKGDDVNSREYRLLLGQDKTFRFHITGRAHYHALSDPVIIPGEWQHVAGTYDGGGKTRKSVVYHNGEEVLDDIKDSGGNLKDGPGSLFLGCFNATGNWFVGEIDEAAVFDTVLDADEIAEIYRLGLRRAVLDVSASGKLAVTWGNIKNKY